MTRLYFDFHPCHFEENRKIIAEEDIDMPEDGAWLSWIDNKYQIERARLKIDAQDHFYPGTKLLDERNIIGWIKNNPLIQEIQDEKEIYNIGFDDGVKAYRNLIELEKEEKEEDAEDCISRQEAIKAIQEEYYDHAVGIDIVDIIAHMPPVIPKAKAGRWEWVQYDANPEIGNFHCSECRYIPASFNMSAQKLNFCPKCGARMEAEA